MKKYILFSLSILTVASFVACGTDNRSESSARLAGGTETGDEAKAGTCDKGGAAGIISLGGVLIVAGDSTSTNEFDPQIKIEQTAGAGADGKVDATVKAAKVEKMSAPLQGTLDRIEKTAKDKTYLNIGCGDLENDVKELSSFSGVTLDAKEDSKDATRVYVCGKQEISAKILSLVTNELILRDGAELTINSAASGTIAIYAEKLTLNGNSVIKLKAEDSADKISVDVAGFNLDVIKTLDTGADGKGTLTIKSIGASCAKQAAPEPPPATEK